MSTRIKLAIDGNEANVEQRVGSNVYAFQLLHQLEKMAKKEFEVTVLLSTAPLPDLPTEREGWSYRVVKPSFLWTQLAAPIHLYLNQEKYDLLYTPGHYAPSLCPIPYVSSIMDLAFLKFPQLYTGSDLSKLASWSKSSVKRAARVITISQASQTDIVEEYGRHKHDVIIAPPGVNKTKSASASKINNFLKQQKIKSPFFLFVGTLQPRKNIENMIAGFEKLCQELKDENKKQPHLVLAGKVGWLAQDILEQVEKSDFKDQITLTGFVSDEIKQGLYQRATASILLGLYEGFGLPALEAMSTKTIPIVADATSLPEVVGEAGILVDPHQPDKIAQAMRQVLNMPKKERRTLVNKGQAQLKKYSWKNSAQTILKAIKKVADEQR